MQFTNLLRSALLLLLLGGILFYHVFIRFGGLTHGHGMDQAQIAREIAMGNGYSTKTLRPTLLRQRIDLQSNTDLEAFKDTYHAPLNPFLLSNIFRFCKEGGRLDYGGEGIFRLDRVVVVLQSIFLIASLAVAFSFASRLFDRRIGVVVALMMVSCEVLWGFARSGLPQCLMLLLFLLALNALLKALEASNQDHPEMKQVFLAGIFMGLLALTHWLTIWIFFGVITFVFLYFRPRTQSILLLLGGFVLLTIPWLVRNQLVSGNALGVCKELFYSGLITNSENFIMNNYEGDDSLNIVGMPGRIVLNTLSQSNDLYKLLGAMVAAPLFFLGLIHPFRKKEITQFKWGLALMWALAAVGMALFGLRPDYDDDFSVSANQMHILFAPVMCAFGLSLIVIFWNRLVGSGIELPFQKCGHFILAIAISALPMAMNFPLYLKSGLFHGPASAFRPNPPYLSAFPPNILSKAPKKSILLTDSPMFTSWYGNKLALLLPRSPKQALQVEKYLNDRQWSLSGAFLTPFSMSQEASAIRYKGSLYGEWSEHIFRGLVHTYPMKSNGRPLDIAPIVLGKEIPEFLEICMPLMQDGSFVLLASPKLSQGL